MSPDGSIYAYVSWGGASLGDRLVSTPPTVHVFHTEAVGSNAPIAQMVTPSPWNTTAGTVSASPAAIDLLVERSREDGQLSVLVLAVGQDCHMNLGSSGGLRYLWRVAVS